MQVEPINQNLCKKSHCAKRIGAASGLAIGSAYIIKNRKDLFIEGGKKAAEALGHTNKAIGIVIPAAVATAIIGASTIAGTLVGAVIDKLKNNALQKKAVDATKQMLAQQIQKKIDKDNLQTQNLSDVATEYGIELE